MQTAPNGGSGPRTRPSRERVGARSAGRGDPVFAVWFARWRRRPRPGSPGRGHVPGGRGRFGRHGRQRLRPLHRELGGAPSAGVFRPGGCSAPSGTQHRGRCGDGHIASKRLASWSSEHGTGSQRARRVRRLATAGKPHRKAGAEQKPHEWQRSRRSQRGRGANRRGSEKLRGRNVPGEASPGRADPVTDVAEGAPEPHEGNRRLSRSTWQQADLRRPPVGGEARTLRGRPSLWEPFGRLRPDRPDDGRPRGREDGEGGAVNQ